MTLGGRVLLLSPDGMLGRAWKVELEQNGIAYDEVSYPIFDLTSQSSVRTTVSRPYRWVINCAAWTDVDGAESNEAEATAVNGTGVGWLADACERIGATLIHYSTDYVFDGEATRPYPTDARCAAINAYGRSKAVGERLVVESGVNHLLIRTSWLYAPWGKNFVRTIAALSHRKEELKVVNDQRSRPTSAQELASCSLKLALTSAPGRGEDGLFHVTGEGDCTWFDFACAIVSCINTPCRVTPCSTADFPRPARRPQYSVLDIASSERLIGAMRPWQQSLDDVLSSLQG